MLLADESGEILASSDFSQSCGDEGINWVAPAAGVYYLVLYEAQSDQTLLLARYLVQAIFPADTPTPSPTTSLTPTASPTPSPTATPSPTPTQGFISVRALDMPAKHVVYDPIHRWLYASVDSSAGFLGRGNSVHLVDPVTGEEGPSIWVGSEPGRLALTEDSEYLYVGLDGGGSIRRVNLSTLKSEEEFTVGSMIVQGPRRVVDLGAVPGSPLTCVAGLLVDDDDRAGAFVYDSGVPRPQTGPEYATTFECDPGGRLIYAYDDYFNKTFYRLNLIADGIITGISTSGLLSAENVDLELAGGMIYTTNGRRINPMSLTLQGTFDASGPVEPDTANNRLFSFDGERLNLIDLGNLGTIRSANISGMGAPQDLVRWGRNGLAFTTSLGKLCLLEVDDPAVLPQGKSATPTPPPTAAFPDSPRILGLGALASLSLRANRIIYDPRRDVIYAAVPGNDPDRPSTITQVDPDSGALGDSQAMGSSPTHLAITADGERLYASVSAGREVAVLDLATFDETLRFGLGVDSFSLPYVAMDIAASPEDPEIVAVSKTTGSFSRIVLHKNGIPLPNEMKIPTLTADRIEFGPSGSSISGLDTRTARFEAAAFLVDSSGIVTTGTLRQESMWDGSQNDIVLAADRIYGEMARVVDAGTVRLRGQFTLDGEILRSDGVAPDPASGHVFFLDHSSATGDITIRVYDAATFLPVNDFLLPDIFTLGSAPKNLIRIGESGLAFIAGGRVHLLKLSEMAEANDWAAYE